MGEGVEPKFTPKDIDLERPNAARVYDYLLGGTANWAIDRQFGELAISKVPMARTMARANRDFLGRAVRYCVRQGITQFLDIGSGVPTVGNVHEVAEKLDPWSRCVYVDNEPVAVAHSEMLLDSHGDPERHAVLRGDLLDVQNTWSRAAATGLLDPEQPVGLLMVAVLHFVSDEEQAGDAVAHYRDLLPPGSYLVLSHASDDGVPGEQKSQLELVVEQYRRSSTPGCLRTRRGFTSFFGDFGLVDPGVTWVPEWRPHEAESQAAPLLADNPAAACVLGGVALKE
ncbi:S-adenosyl methyltransferase [Amycolatopsis marina]|uniref:S-adenosyl methyltransferase n=1 Tax=Amycolatopsis marina TaxID=490629 RepID=A0A1I0V6T4_9PSEU|nr:SAM-dependent methyltransferase [Amycolatopsis marina]SFA71767.1 S-adenosyl methyltransferase [Amycolatopsis marina]